MKLARFSDGGPPRIGLVREEGLIDVGRHGVNVDADMIAAIDRWEALQPALEGLRLRPADMPLSVVSLLAPIERPGKILCIGLNYADHCIEMGLPRPEHQMWFAKVPTSAAGPADPIELPVVSSALAYEAELVAGHRQTLS